MTTGLARQQIVSVLEGAKAIAATASALLAALDLPPAPAAPGAPCAHERRTAAARMGAPAAERCDDCGAEVGGG